MKKKPGDCVDFRSVVRLLNASAGGLELAGTAGGAASADEAGRALAAKAGRSSPETAAELADAMRALEAESAEVDDGVMSSPTHALASLLQSALAKQANAAPTGGGLEMALDGADMNAAVNAALAQFRDAKPHPQPPPDADIALPNDARAFVAGDFGTGLYGAPKAAEAVRADAKGFDLLLHLGDIYYSGQPHEVEERFLQFWPREKGRLNRTLNGNHDMYSKGYGYFDTAFPALGQKSSYFAMHNDNWLLLFLDTAFLDNELDDAQIAWLKGKLNGAANKKVVVFSHHTLFSNFKKPLKSHLNGVLASKRITAWYWGHEHHCVLYDRHEEFGLTARCVGNGGMPSKRKEFNTNPIERTVGDFRWLRMNTQKTPPCLILDGKNPLIEEHPQKYAPQGYAILQFAGASIQESIHESHGKELYSGEIK